METKKIIEDWLSNFENRKKLPIISMSRDNVDLLQVMGNIYFFSDDSVVIEINGNCFIPIIV